MTTSSSICGVAPRPLTSSATRARPPGPCPRRCNPAGSRSAGRPAAWRCARRPSPWMPRPSSISSSASVKPDFSAPGKVQPPSATPIEPSCAAAARAGLGHCVSGSPAAAAAPAILCTNTVPAMPPAFARRVPAQRHVVGDDGDLHRDALGASQLGGQAEVQPVAGVVLDDQQGPAGPGRGADGRQHRIGGRRGEYLAADRRAQHAVADIAGVRGS